MNSTLVPVTRLAEALKAINVVSRWSEIAIIPQLTDSVTAILKLIYNLDSNYPIRTSRTGTLVGLQSDNDAVSLAEALKYLAAQDSLGTTTNIIVAGAFREEMMQQVAEAGLLVAILGVDEIAECLANKVTLTSTDQLMRLIGKRSHPGSLVAYDEVRHASANLFTGRATELNLLVKASEEPRAVTGPRRIGKTSLAHALARALKDRGEQARVLNCQPHEFLHSALGEVLAEWGDTTQLRQEYERHNYLGFLKQLPHAMECESIQLILDEIDHIICNDQVSFDRFVRAIRQASDKRWCSPVFVGWKDLNRYLYDEKRNALFGRICIVELGTLRARDARRLILEPLSFYDVRFDDQEAAVRKILHWTDGHPYFITQICRTLTKQLSWSSRRIKMSDLDVAMRKMIRPLRVTLEHNTNSIEELIVHWAVQFEEGKEEDELRQQIEGVTRRRIDDKRWREHIRNLTELDVIRRRGGRLYIKMPLVREALLAGDYNLKGRIVELARDVILERRSTAAR